MNSRELQRRLLAGECIFGTLIVSTSPRWPEAVARIGLDFVFIDTEHIAIDRHQLSWMCQAYRALGLPPIVRIPSPDPFQASMVLDGGAAGIIAPYVETPEQARRLVGAVKYRPLKGRRLEEALAGTAPFEPALKDYLDRQNDGNLLLLNIESRPAMAALDDILSVPGIDGVLVGPHDLSCSLGMPEQYDHPEFERSVRAIFTRARARGVGAGIHSWMGVAREVEWMRAGANMIIHEADTVIFRRVAEVEFGQLRKASGGSAAKSAPGPNI